MNAREAEQEEITSTNTQANTKRDANSTNGGLHYNYTLITTDHLTHFNTTPTSGLNMIPIFNLSEH